MSNLWPYQLVSTLATIRGSGSQKETSVVDISIHWLGWSHTHPCCKPKNIYIFTQKSISLYKVNQPNENIPVIFFQTALFYPFTLKEMNKFFFYEKFSSRHDCFYQSTEISAYVGSKWHLRHHDSRTVTFRQTYTASWGSRPGSSRPNSCRWRWYLVRTPHCHSTPSRSVGGPVPHTLDLFKGKNIQGSKS